MAVAFDAVGPGATGATGPTSPLTFTHVCGASATHLLVGATWDGATDTGATMSATYNTVAMTSLGVWHTGGGTAGFLQVWYLASPATGSHSVQVTATNSPAGINAGSVSFTGSAGLSAVQSAVSSGTATNPTLTFTGTTSGNMVAAFVGSGSTVTQAGSFTQRYNVTGGSGQAGAGFTAGATIASPGGSTTANWTMAADFYAVAAVEVQAAAAAAVTPSLPWPDVPPGRQSPMAFRHHSTYPSPVPAAVPGLTQAPAEAALAAAAAPATTFTYAQAGLASATAAAPAPSMAKPVITQILGTGTGSYFADQYGQPRFLLGENPWALIPNAGRWGGTYQTDIDGYCNNRGGQGYTAIYLDPLGNTINGGAFNDGRTYDGVWPFTVNGTAGTTVGVSSSATIDLNATFWARVDYFLTACARNGMTGMLNVGYNSDCASGAALASFTTTQWQQYGAALAARYAATVNIIWVVGNDYFGGTGGTIGSGGGTASGFDTQYNSLLTGIRNGGDTHLITVHNFAETTSRQDLGASSLGTVLYWGNNHAQFNGNYTYNVTYLGIEDEYAEASPICAMQLDGYFYQGTSTYTANLDRAYRQDAWWTITSGARGHTHGSESIWQWPSTALSASSTDWFFAHNSAAFRTLIESLPGFHQLIPDTSSVLVTGGRGTRHARFNSGGSGGTYEPATTDAFVTASRNATGSTAATLALIYCSHATTITIDQTKMASGYTAYRADPVTGAKTAVTAGSTYNTTSYGNNSQGDPDWVLILQGPVSTSANAGLAAGTGTAPAPSVIVAPAAGLAAGTASAPAPASAAGANAGLAAGTGTAPAPALTAAANAGLVAGTGTAPAPALTAAANAGLAAGTGTAPAPSVTIAPNAGLAAGTGIAPAPSVTTSSAVSANAGLAAGTVCPGSAGRHHGERRPGCRDRCRPGPGSRGCGERGPGRRHRDRAAARSGHHRARGAGCRCRIRAGARDCRAAGRFRDRDRPAAGRSRHRECGPGFRGRQRPGCPGC